MSKAKGDTEIRMNFTTGNAAAARNIVQEVYRNQMAQMKAFNRQADVLGTSMRKVGRSVLYGLAGYAGVSGASAIFSSLSQGMEDFIAQRSALEKAITPLSSLGDNVKNMQSMRNEVVATSVSTGRSLEEISGFLFDLQSNTGNLSAAMRDQLKKETLELAEVTGGDLVTAQQLMVKSYQIYGKEVENVNQLQNKLMLTQEKAALRFEELATMAPELFSAGQVVGLSLDEVLGSIIGATKKAGSVEKVFTGMRNVFLIMQEAQEKGVTLTGTYLNKIQQLDAMFAKDGQKMAKLFGKESIVAAKILSGSIDDIAGSMRELGAITGDMDTAFEKLETRLKDPAHLFFREMQALNKTIEQAPNMAPETAKDNWLARMFKRYKYGQVTMAVETGGQAGPVFKALGGIHGAMFPSYARAGETYVQNQEDDALFRAHLRQQFETDRAARLNQIDRGLGLSKFLGTDSSVLQERRGAIANELPQPFLQTPEERSSARDLARAMNENTTALKALGKLPMAAPGGSRANAQEAI